MGEGKLRINRDKNIKTDWIGAHEFLLDFAREDESVVVRRNAKKLREGYLIAHLCELLGHQKFRFFESEDFDGQYDSGSSMPVVEVTEITDTGRRRGDEYKSNAPAARSMPINKENVVRRILNAVEEKDRKKRKFKPVIQHPFELLIYVNLNVYRSIEADIRIALSRIPQTCFDVVHILVNKHILLSRIENGEIRCIKQAIAPSDL